MKPVQPSEKSIFLEALDIESTEDRIAFVEAACRGDRVLLISVSALLREHEREDNPVDTPIVAKGERHPFADADTQSYFDANNSFSGHAQRQAIALTKRHYPS